MVDRKALGSDNLEWGKEAEQIAAEYLRREGYVIREQNWRMGHCEIDLILESGRTIIFVEVKARKGDNIDPIFAVNERKRQLIIRAADVYLRRLPHLYEYRFDIITISGDRHNYKMKHYVDAFMPSVNGGKSQR